MSTSRRVSGLIWLIVAWLVFVVSLSLWWLIFSLRTIQKLNEYVRDEYLIRQQNMMIMEGLVLILFLIIGGSALIYFALREKSRFDEVKHFFSTFSHDLKTSISRLVLQTENLAQSDKNSDSLKDIQKNLISLEMQLENSLHFAQHDSRQLTLQPVDIKPVIGRLHTQWPDLKITLQGQGKFVGDTAAVESIFKNLVSNASLHGGADEIQIAVKKNGERVEIRFTDNGQPVSVDVEQLGRRLHPSQKGTGIGLFLVHQWVSRLGGTIRFEKTERGSLEVQLNFATADGGGVS